MLEQMVPVLEEVKQHKCVSFSIDLDVKKPSMSIPSRLLQRQEERRHGQTQNMVTDVKRSLVKTFRY